MNLTFAGVVVDVVWKRVELGVRVLSGVDLPDDLHLAAGQHDVLVVLLVPDRPPVIGVIAAGNEAINPVFLLGLDDLLASKVVADVLRVVVPRDGHVADGVLGGLVGFAGTQPRTHHNTHWRNQLLQTLKERSGGLSR